MRILAPRSCADWVPLELEDPRLDLLDYLPPMSDLLDQLHPHLLGTTVSSSIVFFFEARYYPSPVRYYLDIGDDYRIISFCISSYVIR